MKRSAKYVMGLLLALGTAVPGGGAWGHDGKIYPRDAVVYGRTYSDWSAAWQQWVMSMPAAKHPLFDTADCSEGQSGPVFFLGGRFCAPDVNPSDPQCNSTVTSRECKVPAGKPIYFPVLNTACLDAEARSVNQFCRDPDGVNALPYPPQMRQALARHIDLTTGLAVTIDGKPVEADWKRDFRVQSNVYSVLAPDGNLLQALGEGEIGAGSYLGVDDGIYVMLKPFRKGSVHTVNFKGSFPQYQFSLDFSYRLTTE